MHPFIQKILENTQRLGHHICLGLDPDINKLPHHYERSLKGVSYFLYDVIEATKEHVIAFKPNMAFFEVFGVEGIQLLKDIRQKIPEKIPVILDAKRADIGNTSEKIAHYLIRYFNADAITLHPYMGFDSLSPFFNYAECFHFVLGLTSNPGAKDFEYLELSNKNKLYQSVLSKCNEWHKTYKNIGVVMGATQNIDWARQKYPELLFLVPGVGHQGGNYQESVENSKNSQQLTIINITRELLYASEEKKYLEILIKKLNSYKDIKK